MKRYFLLTLMNIFIFIPLLKTKHESEKAMTKDKITLNAIKSICEIYVILVRFIKYIINKYKKTNVNERLTILLMNMTFL